MADRRDTASALPVNCQKSEEVAIGDAHGAAEPVRHQFASLDPATDGAGRDAQALRDHLDRAEGHGLR